MLSVRVQEDLLDSAYLHLIGVPDLQFLVETDGAEQAVVMRIPDDRANIVRVMIAIGTAIDLKDDGMRRDETRRKHIVTAQMPVGTTG